MDYFKPISATYTIPAATLSAAAVIGRVVGPAGHVGRLVGVTAVVTTGVTTAAAGITLGTAADADAYATMSIPVGAVNTFVNAATNLTTDDNVVAADTPLLLATDGAPAAGAATFAIHVDWYKANPDVSA